MAKPIRRAAPKPESWTVTLVIGGHKFRAAYASQADAANAALAIRGRKFSIDIRSSEGRELSVKIPNTCPAHPEAYRTDGLQMIQQIPERGVRGGASQQLANANPEDLGL